MLNINASSSLVRMRNKSTKTTRVQPVEVGALKESTGLSLDRSGRRAEDRFVLSSIERRAMGVP